MEINSNAAKIEADLLKLESKVAKKIVKKAVRAGAKIILKEEKSIVGRLKRRKKRGKESISWLSALLKRSLQARPWKKQNKYGYGEGVQTKPKVDKFVSGKNYIPAALEFGHGKAKPIFFTKKAADNKGKDAENKIVSELLKGIEEAFNKG